MASAHHVATAGSGATTSKSTGQPWTALATVTYAGQGQALSGVRRELDFDDDHPVWNVLLEEGDDDVRAVFGRLDLGQIDRSKPRLGVGRHRGAEHLDKDLGSQRRAVFEEIHESLVSHGNHAPTMTRTRVHDQEDCHSFLVEQQGCSMASLPTALCMRRPDSGRNRPAA
jgi:hypothetical protein